MNNETVRPTKMDEEPDFRVRVAREKRERMRQRLLFAALDVFLVSERTKPPVIDDVILKAGVSRGTFYKYFDSLDEVLAELGQQMADEMIETYERIFAQLSDPAAKVVAGPLLSLTHAGMQPQKVAFTSKVDFVGYLSLSKRLGSIVTACLNEAKQSGAVHFASLDVATDYIIGATVEGSRRMMHNQLFDKEYLHELVLLIMLGFGMSTEEARQAINIAWEQLNSHSDNLPWWH